MLQRLQAAWHNSFFKMADSQPNVSPGPRRLSWGLSTSQRQQSSSRPPTSSGLGLLQQQPKRGGDSCCGECEAPCRDQQAPPADDGPSANQQACKAVLREVLSAVLGDSAPQLEHLQLTLPAVLAVLQHKLAEAAAAGHNKGKAAAAAAAKQQAAAAQQEAEAKVAKQLQDAAEQSAATAAQHSREVTALQGQVSALQRQHKQLQGKSAQQARDLQEAVDAGKAARSQQQLLQTQVQELTKQLQGKSAALSRSTSVKQQEAAALRAELQQASAAAAAMTAQHQQALQQLQHAHAQQLAQQEAQHTRNLQQQLHEAATKRQQHSQQLAANMQAGLSAELAAVHAALQQLGAQQQHTADCALLAQAESVQESGVLVQWLRQQLQEARQELGCVWAAAQEAARLAAVHQEAAHAQQERQARLVPAGLEALAQQAQECTAARSAHAAALQQLQETCLQLASLQPSMQQLQQRLQTLEAERDVLQAQLAQAAAAATNQQQELQQRAEQLQQQLVAAQANSSQLQQQLQEALSDLDAAQQKAAACDTRAVAAEQGLEQATATHEAQQQRLQAAYATGLQQLQERLQWVCQVYFAPEQCMPAQGSSVPPATEAAAKQSATGDSTTAPAAEASSQSPCGVVADHTLSSTGCAASKLQQPSQQFTGDGERLLQLFELYKTHKQELLAAAAAAAGSSWNDAALDADTLTAASAAAVAAAGIDKVLQLQQQVLQLEACLLRFMLSLQEAAEDARRQQQQQLGSCWGHAGTSPSRPERPGTAMSCSSSATGVSSRSSSLGSQLLVAMRREKQQLALELKKLHGAKRMPLAASVAASATSFPWQRSRQQTTPRGHPGSVSVSGSSSGAATGRQQVEAAEVGPVSPGFTCPSIGAGVPGPGARVGPLPESWAEVDEVLQLLQGCQLGAPSSSQQAGVCSTADSPTKKLPGSVSSSSPKLQWRQGGGRRGPAGGASAGVAAAAVGSGPPGRTVSLGHGSGHPRLAGPQLGSAATLKKSGNCGVHPGGSSMRGLDRGIGSLIKRK